MKVRLGDMCRVLYTNSRAIKNQTEDRNRGGDVGVERQAEMDDWK